MATLNYITLKYPAEVLQRYLELIQSTPTFNVYRNKHQAGIIFRIPHKIEEDAICHFFIEHEVNLSNTLKTGTLTMKVQITVVPVHIGLFSGFEHLEGSYSTRWHDEDYGDDYFVPNYQSADNIKKVVPLPINMKSNLFEYLDEILFNQVSDENIISKYVAQLGCQRNVIKDKIVYIPVPENTGEGIGAARAHTATTHLFESVKSGDISLIPDSKKQLPLSF